MRGRRLHSADSPYAKSLQLVRREFFKFDPFQFAQFTDFYAHKYGEAAKQYLRRTYAEWRSGATRMAEQTEKRILECVPPFLDTSQQFQILGFYVPAFEKWVRTLCGEQVLVSEMSAAYQSIVTAIVHKEWHLDWFVREVFAPAEVQDFIDVFKYTILDRLRQSYAQVCTDLRLLGKIHLPHEACVEVSYHVAFLDCPLDIDTITPPGPPHLDILLPRPPMLSRFDKQYQQILFAHDMEKQNVEHRGRLSGQFALRDVKSLSSHLTLTTSQQEYDSSIEVCCEGGTLCLRLEKKNILKLRLALVPKQAKNISPDSGRFTHCATRILIERSYRIA